MSWIAAPAPRAPPGTVTRAGPPMRVVGQAVIATQVPTESQVTWQKGEWSNL